MRLAPITLSSLSRSCLLCGRPPRQGNYCVWVCAANNCPGVYVNAGVTPKGCVVVAGVMRMFALGTPGAAADLAALQAGYRTRRRYFGPRG